MDNKENKIIDFVFDEIEDEGFEKIPEMEEDFEIFSKIKEELNTNIFEAIDEKNLENQRDILFDSINELKNQKKKVKFINKFYPILKYAAVIALTFYIAIQAPFNNQTNKNFDEKIYNSSDLNKKIVPVSYENTYKNENINTYKIENLSIEKNDNLLDIKFDITAHKEIKGNYDNPEIVSTLNNLLKYQKNPAVRLRTVKAIGKTDDKILVQTLLNTLANDKDILIRRKAMKILAKRKSNPEIQKAFIDVIKKDKDQTIRIMALNYLEKNTSTDVEEVIENLENDKNNYLRFRANNTQD